jgi:hypothetical protein
VAKGVGFREPRRITEEAEAESPALSRRYARERNNQQQSEQEPFSQGLELSDR